MSAMLMIRGSPSVAKPGVSVALATLGVAAALMLAWHSLDSNMERACSVGDTPYLELCPPPADKEQRGSVLRSRIAANPGDTMAYVKLALADTSPRRPQSLQAAAQLAPTHPNVTAMIAAQALEKQDMPGSIPPLITLTEHNNSDKAALVLARLVASGRWQLLVDL
jgi:hypothetical protein